MFRQFVVDPQDRLFLWRNEAHQPLCTLALNTISYGLASSPFQAVRSLFFIADMHEKKYPIGASVLRQDFYVDDMLTGADTLAELNQKKTEVTKILQLVGLSLSKWNSNHLSL